MNYHPVSPNLPSGRIAAALVDFRLPEDIRSVLGQYGISCVSTRRIDTLPPGLCGHPDLQLAHVRAQHAICAPGCGVYYSTLLNPFGISVAEGNHTPGDTYPSDVAYNVARVGEWLICNPSTAEPTLLHHGSITAVRQGYVKCNLCVVDEHSVITSDAGMARCLIRQGFDVLVIEHGHIVLSGYDYGFIGGASGLIAPDVLAFFGRVNSHPDFAKIKGFCLQRGVVPVSLGNGPLTDYGSLLPLAMPV